MNKERSYDFRFSSYSELFHGSFTLTWLASYLVISEPRNSCYFPKTSLADTEHLSDFHSNTSIFQQANIEN